MENEIRRNMDEWKTCPIKIAISGSSGTGKSSFINAFRGLQDYDTDAAPVGTNETTMDPTVYRHPGYQNIELWDLPGVGTPTFPKETYLRQINVDTYDFFLLITCTRFYDDDRWLAKEILSRKKRFYFLRTKIDDDIRNGKRSKRDFNTAEWLEDTKKRCLQYLFDGGVSNPVVFLISSASPLEFDFAALQQQLIDDSPALKREAVALSLTAISEKILKGKLEVLKSRIGKHSALAVLGSLVPIPFVGWKVNYAVMKNAGEFYREQMGIDDKSLMKVANQVGVSLEKLKEDLCLESGKIFRSQGDFFNFCEEAVDQALVDSFAKILPIVGSIISAFKTAPAAAAIQKKLLDLCYKEACRVFEYQSVWLKKNPDVR
ncbi:hypothetical protein DPMN_053129 [Dreissena polymorpha]|uniref:IRG-type G domain-containing protein n=1 Tax=Dreissena polymorpha TaxID=45954 RepID=A0A9D4CKT4_DREPO|nr:hypothetical protein DPMN_053129 [Dreissena polymorpha]